MPRVKRYSTLSDQERAEKRAQALKLLEAGATGAIAARQLGVTKATVSFWKRMVEEEGRDAIAGALRPGRQLTLSDDQLGVLIGLLKKPPSAYRITQRNDAWTWEGIVDLARARLGVECSRQTLMRALKRKGWRAG